jgi:hypothetical protein
MSEELLGHWPLERKAIEAPDREPPEWVQASGGFRSRRVQPESWKTRPTGPMRPAAWPHVSAVSHGPFPRLASASIDRLPSPCGLC